MEQIEIIVDAGFAADRLDKFLGDYFESLSRTKISRLIAQGNVTIDGKIKKASYRLKAGMKILVNLPEAETTALLPHAGNISILYEDEHILVIDKPQGLTTHPPHVNIQDTLLNVLLYMGKTLAPINPLRPGVVHRLDRETSGVMVLAKTNQAYLNLMEQFRRRQTKKEYRAIVWGVIQKDDLTVDLPLARDQKNRMRMKISFVEAKNALTYLTVLTRFSQSSFISLNIFTGRMHQIRVHLKFLGFPIVGDSKYGRKDGYDQLLLHAYKLGFYHPRSQEFISFEAPLPSRFKEFIESQQK